MINQVVSSILAVYFFTMLLEIPKRYAIYASLVGGVNWWVYLVALEGLESSMMAAFFASLAVAILSQIFARVQKTPVTVFLVAGILPTVPGAAIYRCVYYFIHNDSAQCTYYLLQTIQIAGAIAMAIFITDSLFRMLQHYQNRKASIG
ncbi:MAG: threonine/serine exporter family protein [Lachnospiraceae bacterium]|nr:threonine/serine exporter family protein [Lachnospiraceae bacterium]